MFEFNILFVVILLLPIVVTPKLSIVTSPLISTIDATPNASPTIIFPLPMAEPTGETPEMVVLATLVTRPFASTVIVGTKVAEPYAPAVTPLFAKVAAKEPEPEPVTSPVNEIVWSPVLVPLTVALLFTVKVLDAVPPAKVKPFAAEVGVIPLIVLFVNCSTPDKVASVPVTGKVNSVAPDVFNVMSAALPEPVVPVVVKPAPVVTLPPSVIVLPVLSIPVPPFAAATIPVTLVEVPNKLAVIVPALKSPDAFLLTIVLLVFAAVAAFANRTPVWMLDALDPPTLVTVGRSAVPPKSLVNCNLPFEVVVASGVAPFVILAATNAVVAICVVLVPALAVGAFGVPVNSGESRGAFKFNEATVLLRIA